MPISYYFGERYSQITNLTTLLWEWTSKAIMHFLIRNFIIAQIISSLKSYLLLINSINKRQIIIRVNHLQEIPQPYYLIYKVNKVNKKYSLNKNNKLILINSKLLK